MKVVVNNCHGGFGLSEKAYKRLSELGARLGDSMSKESRSASSLIQVVEELGAEANDKYSKLVVIEIPDGIEWELHEENGKEWVAEAHRTWSP